MMLLATSYPAYYVIRGWDNSGFLDVLGQFLTGNLTVIVVSIFAFLPLWFIVYSFKRFRGIIKERRKITKKDVMIFVSSALLMALMMKSLPLAKEIYVI